MDFTLMTTEFYTMAVGRRLYGLIICVFVIVTCGQSKSYSGALEPASYLAPLRLPGTGPRARQEQTLLDDLKRIENGNQPTLEIDPQQKYGLRPDKPYVEMPLKRYMEFVGRRSVEVPLKRFAEFPGKRYYEYPVEKVYELSPAKRDFQPVAPSKRYHEFLGKRNTGGTGAAARSEVDVYKRWAEFLGKRGQAADTASLAHQDELASFYDDSLSEADAEVKRFSEFIG